MATKNNPGRFDCYAAAADDEPMFVLLGRDRHAPLLVDVWAQLRENAGEAAEVVEEARGCANAMRLWRSTRRPRDDVRRVVADAQALGHDAQYAIAKQIAANLGYELRAEPIERPELLVDKL